MKLSKVGTLEEENALLKKSCTDASAKIQQLEMQVVPIFEANAYAGKDVLVFRSRLVR